jgi:hypothetical protein
MGLEVSWVEPLRAQQPTARPDGDARRLGETFHGFTIRRKRTLPRAPHGNAYTGWLKVRPRRYAGTAACSRGMRHLPRWATCDSYGALGFDYKGCALALRSPSGCFTKRTGTWSRPPPLNTLRSHLCHRQPAASGSSPQTRARPLHYVVTTARRRTPRTHVLRLRNRRAYAALPSIPPPPSLRNSGMPPGSLYAVRDERSRN